MKNKLSLFNDYKLHLVVLVATIVAETIGTKSVVFRGITIGFAPLIWAMLIVFAVYMIKPLKLLNEKNVPNANFMMGVTVSLLIAKLGVNSGASLDELRKAGVALVLQNFGNLGTIFLALPVALLLGMKRESIGMSHALSREANVGLIQDNYGATSAEFRGVMAVYIVGTLFGPIIFSIMPSIATSIGLVSPEAASMGVGAGSASMMTAGLSSLIERYPELEVELTAFAGLSNLISSVVALPLGIFLGLPITEFLYTKLAKSRKNK